MSNIKNRVQLIGSLGNQPEIKYLPNAKKVARFSLITTDQYRNSYGEKVMETVWHSMVAWGKVADIIEKYLSKCDEIAIEGKLISRSFLDKEAKKNFISEVEVIDLLMLPSSSKRKG